MLKHQETVLPIFVYGTLMVGERNYIDVLHDNLTHVENAKVKGTLY
ncbi:gamma-glutamylcyclotransferase, partial [Turicibacter sanguinis]|nr:gamma-glutamylcyclotransferase [Turicibacter sanguinis]